MKIKGYLIMSDKNEKIKEIERKINLVKLMIEKRSNRVAYYQKLINMGLTSNDRIKLDYFSAVKNKEIKYLLKELDLLYIQKALYELKDN